MSTTDFARATRRITEGEIQGEMRAACGRFLTADVDVHGSTAAAIKGADALAVITVPCADPATTAGGEEEVSVPVVLDAGQGTVVALQKDGPHSALSQQGWAARAAHGSASDRADSCLRVFIFSVLNRVK